MAHLTPGQQFLLSLPDERVELPGSGDDPGANFKAGLGSTFASAHPASAEEMAAQWELVAHNAGNTLMARTIRYIEDRRAEESRFTGAIERHPSPLGVVWGALDPVAVLPMTQQLLAARPDTPLVVLDDVGHYPMVEAPDGVHRRPVHRPRVRLRCHAVHHRTSLSGLAAAGRGADGRSRRSKRPWISPTCRRPRCSSTPKPPTERSCDSATSTSASSTASRSASPRAGS